MRFRADCEEKRNIGEKKWSFGQFVSGKSGILRGKRGILVKKSRIWGFCEEKSGILGRKRGVEGIF